MIIDYVIVESTDKVDFIDMVKAKMEEGWKFHGTTSVIESKMILTYFQAFIKEEDEIDDE